MNKIINAIIALVSIGLIVACDDDQSYNENGVGREFTIGADTQFSGVESRAIFESGEVNITNYVFLLYGYNENVREATLLFSNEYTSLPVVERLPLPDEGEKYHAIMIANTTVAQLESLGITANSALEKLFSATFDINTTDNKPTNAQKFTWSGYKEVLPDTRYLHFSLNPNLAKITVNVKNATGETLGLVDDIQLLNIQVRNVPNKARFAQNALSKAGFFTTADNATGVTDYIDYEIESLKLAKGESTTTPLNWYMPHNEAGTGTRPNNPATNATWIEVDGVRRLDFMDTAYKIYPGTDEEGVTSYVNLKNFNVKADYQYNFSMTITDDGLKYEGNNNVTDKTTATTSVDKVKLPYNSNCYMIHPLGSRSANGTLYELPINRINEYWGNSWGISSIGDSDNIITDDTEWEAYVIWQDIEDRAIYFADKKGNVNTTSTVYSGTGVTPIYFKLANQSSVNTSQTYGNILIGVRKKGATTCLWSWHLWVTDYNPDAAPPYSVAQSLGVYNSNKMWAQNDGASYNCIDLQGGTYIKPLTDEEYTEGTCWGNVQHYNSMYYTSAVAPWTTGMYANKWIMDRSIGAMTPNNTDTKDPRDGFALYYQYGRKDPFSYKITFDIDGVGRSAYPNDRAQWAVSSSAGDYNKGVENPNTFYIGDSENLWAYDAQTSNTWYSPVAKTPGYKTIFDPCPPGWCIPKGEVFNLGIQSNSDNMLKHSYSTSDAIKTAYTSAHQAFFIWVRTNNSGEMAYPRKHFAMIKSTGDVPNYSQLYDDLDTTLPIQGYIKGENGVLNWIASGGTITNLRCCMWVADAPSSTYYAPLIHIQPTNDLTVKTMAERNTGSKKYYSIYAAKMSNQNLISSRGHNVRCIQVQDGDDIPKYYEEGN